MRTPLRRPLVGALAALALVTGGSSGSVAQAADNRPVLNLTVDAVQGVKFGTPASSAEKTLRSKVGKPTRVTNYSCEIHQERAKQWQYGSAVGIGFSDIDNKPGDKALRLTHWYVGKGSTKYKVNTPYNVRIGTAAEAARKKIPGGKISYDEMFGYAIHTDRAPSIVWVLSGESSPGPVEAIIANPVLCE